MRKLTSYAARALFVFTIFLLSVNVVWAQTIPVSGNSAPSGTITTTGTFQVVQAQTNNRIGCTIINNASLASGDLMWVYFDNTNSANCSAAVKSPRSVILQPGQPAYCTVGAPNVLKDQVCITGTAGDPFYANFQ